MLEKLPDETTTTTTTGNRESGIGECRETDRPQWRNGGRTRGRKDASFAGGEGGEGGERREIFSAE
jgi:hypothetical protein